MTTFAPSARRGDFLYSSLLYADAGNSNHHPRASVAELAALLRPEAPNLYSKNRQPDIFTPAKDPPWHFYSAQLIHYGLPVTKDKNAAKVRLLNALNQFKLEVPAWVVKVEGDLRKEWETANRRMKKERGSFLGGRESQGTGAERTQGQGDVNVTVNLTLSPGHSMQEQARVQKLPSTPKKLSLAKRKRIDSSPQEFSLLFPSPQKISKLKRESTPKIFIKEDPISTPARARVKREFLSPRSSSTPSPYIKPEPYANDATPSRSQSSILLSGTYNVHIYCANPLYDNTIATFTLCRDSGRSIWWGDISFAPFEGLIKMDPGPGGSDSLGAPCSLGWRLRNVQDGSLTFGRKCTGEMTFFAEQTFSGALFQVPEFGTVVMEGVREPGPSVEGDFQEEWDGFVAEAYGR